jgi:hypothetical protein
MPKTFKISKSPANFASILQIKPASLVGSTTAGSTISKSSSTTASIASDPVLTDKIKQQIAATNTTTLVSKSNTAQISIDPTLANQARQAASGATSIPTSQKPKIKSNYSKPVAANLTPEEVTQIRDYVTRQNPQPVFFSSEIIDPSIVGMFDFENLYESCTSDAASHFSATGLYADIQFQSSLLLNSFDITQLILQHELAARLAVASKNAAELNAIIDPIRQAAGTSTPLVTTDTNPFLNDPATGPQKKNLSSKKFVSATKQSFARLLADVGTNVDPTTQNLIKWNTDEITSNLSQINDGVLATLSILDDFEKSKFRIESYFRENDGSSSVYDMLVKHFGYTKEQVNKFSRTKIFLQFLSELSALSMFRLEPHKPSDNDSSPFNINNISYSNALTIADFLDDNVDKGIGNYGIKVNQLPNFIQVYGSIAASKEQLGNTPNLLKDTIDIMDGQIDRLLRLDKNNSENRFKQSLEFCVKEYFYTNFLNSGSNVTFVTPNQNLVFFKELYGNPSNTIAKIDITKGRVGYPVNSISNNADVIGPSVYTFESADLLYKDISGNDASGSAGSYYFFDSFFQKENFSLLPNGRFSAFADINSSNFSKLINDFNSSYPKSIPTFLQNPEDPESQSSKTASDYISEFINKFEEIVVHIHELDADQSAYDKTIPVNPSPGNSAGGVGVGAPSGGRNVNPTSNNLGNIDPSKIGITFDRLSNAATDSTLRKNIFKLIIGTCADILFPRAYYPYVYDKVNENSEAPFPYLQINQTQYGYQFDTFHLNCGIKSRNSNDVDPYYAFNAWSSDLRNIEINKVVTIANTLRVFLKKDFLRTFLKDHTAYSAVNMLLMYQIIFDMLCQYCKITTSKSSTSSSRSGRGAPQGLQTKLTHDIINNEVSLNFIKTSVLRSINSQLECQRILKNFIAEVNKTFADRTAIVNDINSLQPSGLSSSRGRRVRSLIDILTLKFGFDETKISRVLNKHQLLLVSSQIFDTNNILKDDLLFKILDPSMPTPVQRDILFSAAKNDLLHIPGIGIARKKIFSIGIPENVLDKLRIDGTGYGSKYARQPINDFFYITINRFNMLNRGLQFKPKKFLFQSSRFVVKDSLPLDTNIQNPSIIDFIKQYSTIASENIDYVNYGDIINSLSKDGKLKDITLNSSKNIGLKDGDLQEVQFNHALSYVLEIYIKSIMGVGVFENQFNDFYFGDNVQMSTNAGRFGFLLSLPNELVPPAFKSLIANVATNLSDPDQISLKILTPKYFDRAFNMLFGDDDFEIDNENSDSTTLQNFINDEFLTAKTDGSGNPILDEKGNQVYFLNSRDFSLDQLIVNLESYAPSGVIKSSVPNLIIPVVSQGRAINGATISNLASLSSMLKP